MASARKGFTFQMPGQMVIASFMLRFVKEKGEGEAAGARSRWRVYLRHIQSGKEQYFATLQAAFSFLEEYLAKDEAGEEVLDFEFGANKEEL